MASYVSLSSVPPSAMREFSEKTNANLDLAKSLIDDRRRTVKFTVTRLILDYTEDTNEAKEQIEKIVYLALMSLEESIRPYLGFACFIQMRETAIESMPKRYDETAFLQVRNEFLGKVFANKATAAAAVNFSGRFAMATMQSSQDVSEKQMRVLAKKVLFESTQDPFQFIGLLNEMPTFFIENPLDPNGFHPKHYYPYVPHECNKKGCYAVAAPQQNANPLPAKK